MTQAEGLASTAPARVIGIGASAGGLEALRDLVSTLPTEFDLRIVVVQHLSPTHRSMLVGLLARESKLPVVEVAEGMVLRPNTIHITPPACHIRLKAGVLKLSLAQIPGTPKPSIDEFFASLAEECGPLAVGVVLSGTGHDGRIGIRRIHAAGGVTIAQDPRSARYDGMPLAAIETGCVHHILPPDLIGSDIVRLGCRESGRPEPLEPLRPPLERISATVRRGTGVEIGLYKESTLQRRLKRRMSATGSANLQLYADHLDREPEEIGRLMREMLISVTSFFRDTSAFKCLAQAIRDLVRGKRNGEELRIWIAGCASGEEAYSIAILVSEEARLQGLLLNVRLFATDLDQAAIVRARRGRFPREALSSLAPELRDRYFSLGKDEQLASKSLREMLIFSVHNLIGDPVFSRLDLISCRNVLIYFRPELQTQLLEAFHVALNPGGLLFLGKSESTQHNSRLFAALDEKNRLYQRRADSETGSGGRRSQGRPMPRAPARERASIFERLLRVLPGTVLPASVLVDGMDLGVRHVFGDVSRWVRLGDGEFSTDLLRLVVRPLRVEVRSLAMKAQRESLGFVEHTVQGREIDGPVTVSVLRIEEAEEQPGMLLISFRPVPPVIGMEETHRDRDADHESEVTQLETQLASTREHLHTVIEELETSNEELQSLNEEMQSSNEELTSSNEELETANEELQSTNQELTTVNEELESKTIELFTLNNDLENVKNSLPQPIVVIDERSRIMLFNRSARQAFDLPEDSVGESLFAIPGIQVLGALGDLSADTARVLVAGQTIERQIEGVRTGVITCSPFRSAEGQCIGVVVMFMDNALLRAAEQGLGVVNARLLEAERFASETIDALPQAVCVIDAGCRIVNVNRHWREAIEAGGGSEARCGVGADYAAICELAMAMGDRSASEFLAGMRAVVSGRLPSFVVEYECQTPTGMSWFVASVTAFSELSPSHWLVMHVDITQRKVREHTIRLQSVALEASAAGVFIADAKAPGLPIVYVNPAFERMMAAGGDQLIGRNFTALFPDAIVEMQRAALSGTCAGALIEIPGDAGSRHAELDVHPILGPDGRAAHFTGVIHDVTDRVHASQALRGTLEREQLALSFAEIGSLEWNVRAGTLRCSELQLQLLGLPTEEPVLSYAGFRELLHRDDVQVFDDAFKYCLAGHSALNLDYRVIWRDGSLHWLRSRGNAILDRQGAPRSVLCLTQDVTHAKESELRARFLAHHDSLTGLANRSLLEDRLQQAMLAARRSRLKIAVAFLDLDKFKEVNDVLGHHVGDQLLKAVAQRLQLAVRQTDSVCRHSGDEFIVLLPGVHDSDEAGRIVQKMHESLRRPYNIAGHELHATASIGIAIYPDDGDSIDVLVRNADAAMYQAKEAGRDSLDFFSPQMNAQLVSRIETARQLRRSLGDLRLELHYQPQIEIASGRLIGIEALLRWHHPERGLLMPDEFIPMAEDSELIHDIGSWVVGEACRQNRAWQDEGFAQVPIAVNVSPMQFRRPDFVERMSAALAAHGLAPGFLELEVTERLLMHDSPNVAAMLDGCHQLGIRLAIDDFGTGYSSLTYLQRFPFERIKIDRSFVATATHDLTAAAICRAVIHLGRALGHNVLAEGVENQEQLLLLRAEGCDAYQGYLCSRPLAAAEFRSLLLRLQAGSAVAALPTPP